MTKRDYTVAAGILELPEGDTIRLNSPQWWEWLESEDAVAFTFDCDHGIKNYRARKEEIKGKSGRFWYAYKRHNGTLRKRYIGKSEELSLEKLETIAYDLLTPPKAKEPQSKLPTSVGNDVGEYRELLNESRRIAAQRESDFERLIAQKVEVCKENQKLKEQLQLLHTQVGNDEIENLKAELKAANERITQLETVGTGGNNYTSARCHSGEQITLELIEAVIHDKNWSTPIERHRQDPKTNVRYWALVKLLDELSES